MKHRIIGLFGIFIPIAILGSLMPMAAPCHKDQMPIAPRAQTQAVRPVAPDTKTTDCTKVTMKNTGDVCKELAGAV